MSVCDRCQYNAGHGGALVGARKNLALHFCLVLGFLLIAGCRQQRAVAGLPGTTTTATTNVSRELAGQQPTPGSTARPRLSVTTPATRPATTAGLTPAPYTATSTATQPATATSSATARVFATLDGALPTPPTAVPTPVPALAKPDHVTNVALLGNDVEWPQGGRTDSIIVVSIDRQARTATMLSLPRDLYVYIPGWKMARINLALPHGHGSGYPGGGGGLIKDTILYNFGIPIDYYVRIGFKGFKQVVDTMGGVEVVVNCSLRDWRLKAPELDPTVEENWEQFTLEPGIHTMDGDLALWYVRSRLSSNDFDRGRRQQQVLRALFNQGIRLNLLPQIPGLWDTYRESIETDMSLPLMLELAALAPEVRDSGLAHLTLAGEAVRAWRVPATGETVQLVQWGQAQPIFERLLRPPALSRASRPPISVEVVTASDTMYRRVAENLAWYGFVPVRADWDEAAPGRTRITYYAPNFKESYVRLLSWVFHQEAGDVELARDVETGNANYRVILGRDANPCLRQLEAPYDEGEA